MVKPQRCSVHGNTTSQVSWHQFHDQFQDISHLNLAWRGSQSSGHRVRVDELFGYLGLSGNGKIFCNECGSFEGGKFAVKATKPFQSHQILATTIFFRQTFFFATVLRSKAMVVLRNLAWCVEDVAQY